MPDRRNLSTILRPVSLALMLGCGISTQVFAASSEGSLVPAAKEQEYINLAARVVATVDACTAIEVIDPGLGFLDEIEVGMLDLGASPEEIEEWMSTVTASKSPAIQEILKTEDKDAVWLQCTKDIDEKRRKLAGILSGEEVESAPEGIPDSTTDGQ